MKSIILLFALASCATHIPYPPPAPPVSETIEATRPEPVKPVPEAPKPRTVFSSKSTLSWMVELVRVANCVVNTEAFLAEIGAFPKYDFTDKTPAQVAEAVRRLEPVTVATYYTKWRWSKAIATTWASEPEVLYLNLYKHPRPLPESVNTVIHEGLHPEFGHGDNSSVGKENSVNYRAGAIAEKYVAACARF